VIRLYVNGGEHEVDAHPMKRLLDVVRDDLGLLGAKEGCGEGECGACAVEVDGRLVVSCLVPIGQCAGSRVRTVEGLAPEPGVLSRVQQAFLDHGGAQCGICTPGMLMAASALLARVARPTEADIREGLSGNLCRCTGYMKIFEAVVRAVEAD
jgi:aerobic carbon-monoxide dehydrogenase small subunit